MPYDTPILAADASSRLQAVLVQLVHAAAEPGEWTTFHDDELCAAMLRSRRTIQNVIRDATESGVVEAEPADRSGVRRIRIVAQVSA